MNEVMVEGSEDPLKTWHRDGQADRERRVAQLRDDARAVYRAMEGWQRVESEDDWLQLSEESREAYRTGRFLLEQLGAERYLDPELMALLVQLRRGLVGADDHSAAEGMVADLAVTSYYNSLRLQRWIGDLAIAVEHEFFGGESPTAQFHGRYGRQGRLKVEDQLARLGEQLLPLQERANRMMLRNLKALADLRRVPAPAVAIGNAQQVNVGTQQVNLTRENGSHETASRLDDGQDRRSSRET